MRIRALLVLCGIVITTTGCQTLAPAYTLSPAVRNGAEQYGNVMSDFTNQALLENVLRARDFVPLNFNDLSAITASFSLSATAGLTVPFGRNEKGGPTDGASGFKYTLTPSISGSASPVLTLGTLDTQGFMLSMLQPVSTTYILSKWDTTSHELLLRLFVKSIRFSDESSWEQAAPQGCKVSKQIYRNDPDNECDFLEFNALLTQLVYKPGNVDLKSLMVLEPIGRPVPAGKTVSATIPAPKTKADTTDAQYAVSFDASIFQTISGLADGQLHAGNAACPQDEKALERKRADKRANICAKHDKAYDFVQFYKEYTAQVALCLDPRIGRKFYGHNVADIDNAVNNDETVIEKRSALDELKRKHRNVEDKAVAEAKDEVTKAENNATNQAIETMAAKVLASITMSSAIPGGTGGGGGGNGSSSGGGSGGSPVGGSGGGASAGAATSGASTQVTMALQPNRISAMLPGPACAGDELVLRPEVEQKFSNDSEKFIHVKWRSVTEVIQYLGAIARHERPDKPNMFPAVALLGGEGNNNVLFSYVAGKSGPITTEYRGNYYSVPPYWGAADSAADDPAITNHSAEVLSMLNELISLSKVSGSLPVSQPVQVLPP